MLEAHDPPLDGCKRRLYKNGVFVSKYDVPTS
jgi:hypothetical protein